MAQCRQELDLDHAVASRGLGAGAAPGRPAHGYELKSTFEQAGADQRARLNIRHLYRVLGRLSQDGSSNPSADRSQGSPMGCSMLAPADRLDRWLGKPSARLRGYRHDFFLKLMAAVQTGDLEMPDGSLRRQRSLNYCSPRPSCTSGLISACGYGEKNLKPELASGKRNLAKVPRKGAAAAGEAAPGTTGPALRGVCS